MMAHLAWLGLPEVVAGALVVALNAYVVTGGADFGGGVWDLLARGPQRDAQRALIAHAIGPIWEANHVWLILVVVLLFTCFPDAFATLFTVLHIPLSLMLVGIVLRGSSFVFRSYGSRDDAAQRRWSVVFATTSIITPMLLGVIVGAIASGAVGAAAAQLSRQGGAVPAFTVVFVAPWLAPFPWALGALALAMFSFLAAVYLAVAATEEQLREAFRRRALGAAAAVFVAAFAAIVVAFVQAPAVGRALMLSSWSPLLQAATGLTAVTAIGALLTRRWRLARAAAVLQVSFILWGWALLQYPFLVPGRLTLRDAAAPHVTLVLTVWALVGGGALLLPSLAYLYRNFTE